MPCYRCGVRQTDPERGSSPWRRGVRHDRLVLVCPACQGELRSRPTVERDGEIEEGTLECQSCGLSYPVRRGIPRLLTGTLEPDPSAVHTVQHLDIGRMPHVQIASRGDDDQCAGKRPALVGQSQWKILSGAQGVRILLRDQFQGEAHRLIALGGANARPFYAPRLPEQTPQSRRDGESHAGVCTPNLPRCIH